MKNTKIGWTNHSHNFWTGCTKVAPECANCYAEGQAKRNTHTFGQWGPGALRRRTSDAYWRQPYAWDEQAKKLGEKHRVFSNSMADIWDDDGVPIEWLVDALEVMRTTPNLIWLLLTKRPENIRKRLELAMIETNNQELYDWLDDWVFGKRPPSNVWLGVTAGTNDRLFNSAFRIFDVPAALYFLSAEPLLEPLPMLAGFLCVVKEEKSIAECRREGIASPQKFGWVITGGESGFGKRIRAPHPDWFRAIRDVCFLTGTPFFFKQWGSFVEADIGNVDRARRDVFIHKDGRDLTDRPIDEHGLETEHMVFLPHEKEANGNTLDGEIWEQIPE